MEDIIHSKTNSADMECQKFGEIREHDHTEKFQGSSYYQSGSKNDDGTKI